MIIDIVYTYVDSTDNEWQKEKHIAKNDDLEKYLIPDSSFNSSLNEILYSIRSIEKFLKFNYGKIYIVSNNGKLPIFFKNNSNIICIKYTTLLNNVSYNSDAIESVLHLIPDLSENFLYFNDDFFLLKDVYLSDFIDENNKLIWYKEKEFLWKIDNQINKLNMFYNIDFATNLVSARRINTYKKLNIKAEEFDMPISHSPKMFNKSLIKRFIHEYNNEINDLRNLFKFRNINDFLFCDGFCFWGIKNNLINYKNTLKTKILIQSDFLLIDLQNLISIVEYTFKKDCHFLSISDIRKNNKNNYFKHLLDHLFPQKSIYEL